MREYNRLEVIPEEEEVDYERQRIVNSWRLRPHEPKRKVNTFNLGCMVVRQKCCLWIVGVLLFTGLVTLTCKKVPRQHHHPLTPDSYTAALHKALLFFNAQRSGKLPFDNNITWRGNSGMSDDLVGGYYDAGDAFKFHFPQSFAMTMLSWSVIEYGDISRGSTNPNDEYCWMRPEDMDYPRPVLESFQCSDLAGEMAAALAAASIVYKDDEAYSRKLVHGATTLYTFSKQQRGQYSIDNPEAAIRYNSSGYYDEILWGGVWLYYATGNWSYLSVASDTTLDMKLVTNVWTRDSGVLSWDNKLAGAKVLLSRLRIFLNPGHPYESFLSDFHKQTEASMCSYLFDFSTFNRTKGGLILLNHREHHLLQYVVNAAFLATLYSDYLHALDIPGWYCGPQFYSTNELREFAKTQINYILGNNTKKMSYVVGFGMHYPMHVHHRGASIPKNEIKYSCQGGWEWRDTMKPNPNILVGAMVAGPDKEDNFYDVRTNYNYTEPTLAGNAGLVAALVGLSGDRKVGIDKNTIFTAVAPMFPTAPPPPAPWQPGD